MSVGPLGDTISISPYIYGSNAQSDDRDERITARRQGGNRLTGYNWENNASNAGNDYIHHSDNYLTRDFTQAEQDIPGIVLTKFHEESLAMGAYSLVTLPAAGFVARDKHGTVEPNESAPSPRWREVVFRKPGAFSTTPDTTDAFVYVDEETRFLVDRFGGASSGRGVRGYAIDNEPALWPSTHARLHPEPTRARELIEKSLALAAAVKSVDRDAEIFGGVFYGYSEYLNEQNAPDWNEFSGYGTYLDAFLAEMKKGEDRAGSRLVDVLDIHWYPEARGRDRNGALVRIPFDTTTDSGVAAARMQAPRSLWDSTYTEESWIGQYFSPVALLPSINASIARYYPGTRLAVTEFNYGGENHISGAIAIADVLGILGEQRVYMANHWGPIDGFVSSAYRLYRNYDGAGGSFGSRGLRSRTADNERSALHSAIDSLGRLHMITINRGFDETIEAEITLPEGSRYRPGRIYILTGESREIREMPTPGEISNGLFRCSLPPLSVAHLILEPEMPVAVRAGEELKESFTLHPSPASTEIVLGYSLAIGGHLRIEIVDPLGRRIRDVFTGAADKGLHTMTIPIAGIAPGVYFCRLRTEHGVRVERVIVR